MTFLNRTFDVTLNKVTFNYSVLHPSYMELYEKVMLSEKKD